jgi:hypothetical protein
MHEAPAWGNRRSRFITTDGTRLEIYTCNGGANQQWQLP